MITCFRDSEQRNVEIQEFQLTNSIIIITRVWLRRRKNEKIRSVFGHARRSENREGIAHFNLKMQLSRNGRCDCLFACQGGTYKKKYCFRTKNETENRRNGDGETGKRLAQD